MNTHHKNFSDCFLEEQRFWNNDSTLHTDLIATKKLVYDSCQFIISEAVIEPESAEYGASIFKLNGSDIRFRVAKITPTKTGQFVTLWKRSINGTIQPFDALDPIDFFVISVRSGENFGQFVFPKSILCEKNVFSVNSKGGKRAIRVYPPWNQTTSKQAKKTQEWQVKYFLEVPKNRPIDHALVKSLYSNH